MKRSRERYHGHSRTTPQALRPGLTHVSRVAEGPDAEEVTGSDQARQLLALGHDEDCRAGQWPPPGHHPAGRGQHVANLVLAVDRAFPPLISNCPAIMAAKNGWVWVGSVQKPTSSTLSAPDRALACTRSRKPRLC